MSDDIRNLRASLKQSEANRAAMVQRFGFVPHSVISEITRGSLSKQLFLYQQERREHNSIKSDAVKAKREKLSAAGYMPKISPSNAGNGRGKAGLSIMPAELVAFFIKYYAKPGDLYLDPFAGQGVQMQVAKLLGLHYHGYDLSHDFCTYIRAVKDRIDDGTTELHITEGDSRNPSSIADNSGDFSFHSPPYWDIEYYGDEPEQLGYKQSYEDFLIGMQAVASAWLPKFKSGAYHVVNVNDFRAHGRFYAYHADTIALFQRAGWGLHDIWIIDGLVGGLPKAFAVDFNRQRIAPKVHEYAIVFRKP